MSTSCPPRSLNKSILTGARTKLASLQLPWSDAQRAVFSLPKRTGTYARDDCSVRLYGFESHPLSGFTAEVDGVGNPLPFLKRVCLPNLWTIVGDAGRESVPIDLDADPALEWAAFQRRESASHALVGAPDRVRIPHNEHRFQCVGRQADGKQFMGFVTAAFPSDWWSGSRSPEYLRDRWAEHKGWYAVLHRFDPEGNHLGTEAWSGGTTADGESQAVKRADDMLDEMLASLRECSLCDINVKPFGVEIDGYFFGLVYEVNGYEDPANPKAAYECVMLEPNDIMFHPPWDSGDYST